MIYMEPTSLGYDVLIQSWLNTIPESLGAKGKAIILSLFDEFVPSILPHLRRNCVEPLPTMNNCLVEAVLNLMDTFLNPFRPTEDGASSSERKSDVQIQRLLATLEPIFIFSLVWGMCATVNKAGRRVFDVFLRSEMASNGLNYLFPTHGSIYDFKVKADFIF